jgi:predicted DNA-binding protein (MmcQ/YjbR family)
MAPQRDLRRKLLDYALAMPGAHLDHPWGEDVVKVNKKIFAFFGTPDGDEFGMGVKLPQSNSMALAQPGVKPSGYGLGKAGWVSTSFSEPLPFEMLRDWLDESYRAVAPKRLAAALGDGSR